MQKLLLSIIFLLLGNGAAMAQGCVDYDIYDAGKTYPGARLVVNYIADIQQRDLFNSKGLRLTKAEQVLRQDRANYHKLGLGSGMDTDEGFFDKSKNRPILESARYVTSCGSSVTELKREILHGQVPGVVDVMVFKMLSTGRYVVFINIVG